MNPVTIINRLISLVPRAVSLKEYQSNHGKAYSKIQNKIEPTLNFVKEVHASLSAGTLAKHHGIVFYDYDYSSDKIADTLAHRLTLHQKPDPTEVKHLERQIEDEGKFIEFFTGLDNSLKLDKGIRMGVTNFQNAPIIHMHCDESTGKNSFTISDGTERDVVPNELLS